MDRAISLAACLLAAAACPRPETAVPLDQDVELAPGQAMKIAASSLRISFDSVAEDSRCPSGVQCVWAGNARVLLTLTGGGPDTAFALNTTTDPRQLGVREHVFELKQVTPGPTVGGQPAAGTYRITLRVHRP